MSGFDYFIEPSFESLNLGCRDRTVGIVYRIGVELKIRLVVLISPLCTHKGFIIRFKLAFYISELIFNYLNAPCAQYNFP